MFNGREILIATKHHKEKVMAPILKDELGLQPSVTQFFDTDVLGTFTGEVERTGTPYDTVKRKCLDAAKLTNVDLVIANEGSFGPHPQLFFANADSELMMLIDLKNNIEVTASEISLNTNFFAQQIFSEKELLEVADKVKFPSHAVILRAAEGDFKNIKKGICSEHELIKTFTEFYSINGSVYFETDMRAMYNPSRMEVIKDVTYKLVNKLKSLCPECSFPGYEAVERIEGLKCEQCGFPTKSALYHVYKCKQCDFSEQKFYPNYKEYEDPMYCDVCNP